MAATFWKGKNSTLIFMLRGKRVQEFNVVSWQVKREGTEIADPICGQNRDELDFETNYFSITVKVKSRTLKLIRALLAEQANRDAMTTLKDSAMGFVIKPNDGTKGNFQAVGYVMGGWDINVGGRVERNETSLPGRARDFLELPAAA